MDCQEYVIGNWKMYKTSGEATQYLEQLLPLIEKFDGHIFLSVPFTSIASAASFAKNTKIVIGAQNMNETSHGAFTGEIASIMLKDAGATFVILGHSERRKHFFETNDVIHKKVVRALQDDIIPVLCIGETLEEKDSGMMQEVLKEQIYSALEGISPENGKKLILAYEPVWAIGTGRSADNLTIDEAHNFCRKCLIELWGEKIGNLIPIVYGGSVNIENVAEIINHDNVNGVLVGGASLDARSFASIALQCKKSTSHFQAMKSLEEGIEE